MTGLGETPGQRDCSPRVRGWSRGPDRIPRRPLLLPARAGLVPSRPRSMLPATAAPHPRLGRRGAPAPRRRRLPQPRRQFPVQGRLPK
ncbi:hypothetical protein C0R04_12525 [Streptomyces albidoflavus]|nr:hypothetical protein C0R04_12525 [Streptomyces albidoflavus]RZE96164.1 hypothetical protein C0R03_12550 [Streptomyces albidoflavus]